MADRYSITIPALELSQGQHKIYLFGIDGKLLHDFATVSRVHRSDKNRIGGYQRPEVASHIKAIRRYLESDSAMLPNALVLAFDNRVVFRPTKKPSGSGYTVAGELEIPIDETLPNDEKVAWIVDGQQRSAAIRDADIAEFPVAVVGFIASGQEEQRSQFILVNNTKPLPNGLVHELLPDTTGELPPRYARRKLPASLMTRLNSEEDSPFYRIISTPTSPDGYVKDNSVLRMIENSLYQGALYRYRDPVDGSGDVDQMTLHLKTYWAAVKDVFEEAWESPPRRSRLTHGVGIQSMGFVMDTLTEGTMAADLPGLDLAARIAQFSSVTAWMEGEWPINGERRPWNSLQNTPNDVRLLTNHLLAALLKIETQPRKPGRRASTKQKR